MNQSLENPTLLHRNNTLRGIGTLIGSLTLGILFIYLFLWKVPGIAHFIYFVALTLYFLIPPLLSNQKELLEKFTVKNIVLFLLSTLLSLVLLYRLNDTALQIAFLTFPIAYIGLITNLFIPHTTSRFNIFSFLEIPAMLVASWFSDIVVFFKSLNFRSSLSAETESTVKKVLQGVIIALPFLLVFIILLTSADQLFSDLLEKILKETIGEVFSSTSAFALFMSKLVVGGVVSLYLMGLSFSLWNPNSKLASYINERAGFLVKNREGNWNYLSVSTFLFLINTLFLLFLLVQFSYLFAGEQNILGLKANYTYSEYLRRGFLELLATATLVYIIAYIISVNVKIESQVQRLIYRVNIITMVSMTLLITLSSHARIWLTEKNYGFTHLRLYGHGANVVIAVMLITLLYSLWIKKGNELIKTSTAWLVVFLYFIYLIVPTDLLLAQLNYVRYQRTNDIDLPYVLNLSGESIPALLLLSEETESETMRSIIRAHLGLKYLKTEKKRTNWQSSNIGHEINERALQKYGVIDENGKPISTWEKEAEDGLKRFLIDYTALIEAGEADEAYKKYWSKNTTKIDLDELKNYRIVRYEIEDNKIPEFSQWSILNYRNPAATQGIESFDYWTGMYIPVKLIYIYDGYTQEICRYDNIRVKLEDGEWKVMYSDETPLANFKDKGDSRYYYEKSDYSHLAAPNGECD